MKEEFSKLNKILSYLNKEEKNKIPPQILQYIQDNSYANYKFRINTSKELEEQNIQDSVLIAFAYISRYYSDVNINNIELKLYEKNYQLLNKIIEIEKQSNLFNLFDYNKFISKINSITLETRPKIVEEPVSEFEIIKFKNSIFSIMLNKIKIILFNKKTKSSIKDNI